MLPAPALPHSDGELAQGEHAKPWVAHQKHCPTNIDIIFSFVAPYRFFYVWVPEDGDWKIVVSHDSVSNWPRLA